MPAYWEKRTIFRQVIPAQDKLAAIPKAIEAVPEGYLTLLFMVQAPSIDTIADDKVKITRWEIVMKLLQ